MLNGLFVENIPTAPSFVVLHLNFVQSMGSLLCVDCVK